MSLHFPCSGLTSQDLQTGMGQIISLPFFPPTSTQITKYCPFSCAVTTSRRQHCEPGQETNLDLKTQKQNHKQKTICHKSSLNKTEQIPNNLNKTGSISQHSFIKELHQHKCMDKQKGKRSIL